jgi:hypothetical protein
MLPYGSLGKAFDWCEDNCSHKWFLNENQSQWGTAIGSYYFAFQDENEAIAFSLKFSEL